MKHLGVALCVSLVGCALFVAGCALPGDATPVVKMGLIAPFEGLGRPLGYAVLPAVERALAEANTSGQLGRYRVALVALDDDLYGPAALAQAKALAQQADVVGAVGLWSDDTAGAASPVLSDTGIPALLAAPLSAELTGVYSLCPSLAEMAAGLLGEAARIGEPTVIAGPPTALAAALETAAPGLVRICADGLAACPTPCMSEAGSAGAPVPCRSTVVFTDDAASAGDDLARWRSLGWQGVLLGGPELARPWLLGRAGSTAEGARAIVCSYPSAIPETGDAAVDNEARLAYAGTRALLGALARDIAAHGRPGRAGVGAEVAKELPAANLIWLRVENGRWIAAK
jgi:hypothetical protein